MYFTEMSRNSKNELKIGQAISREGWKDWTKEGKISFLRESEVAPIQISIQRRYSSMV